MTNERTAGGTETLDWFKSSYSSDQGGACLEIATAPDAIHVRDSKNPSGPTLCLTPSTWTAFLTHATPRA